MPDPVLSSMVVRFDIFEVDLRAGELRKEGRPIKLQEQPFRVLSLLLERSGEVVTRDELRQNPLAGGHVCRLRSWSEQRRCQAARRAPRFCGKPRFIETVAKRGYRFI
jgi:DNA-binding winged helix-turn-helix (wHTH) protein